MGGEDFKRRLVHNNGSLKQRLFKGYKKILEVQATEV